MNTRSNQATIRNPLLSLPAAEDLQSLSPEAKAALRKLLKQIQMDARVRAQKCWETHKAPMAAYWKAVSVYANHTSRLLKETA